MSTIACFISRYTDYLKPFFNVIKKAKAFEWTIECEETFLVIKKKKKKKLSGLTPNFKKSSTVKSVVHVPYNIKVGSQCSFA